LEDEGLGGLERQTKWGLGERRRWIGGGRTGGERERLGDEIATGLEEEELGRGLGRRRSGGDWAQQLGFPRFNCPFIPTR
jgi:hypothetical protein